MLVFKAFVYTNYSHLKSVFCSLDDPLWWQCGGRKLYSYISYPIRLQDDERGSNLSSILEKNWGWSMALLVQIRWIFRRHHQVP